MQGNKRSDQQLKSYPPHGKGTSAAPTKQPARLPKRHIPTADGLLVPAVPPLPDGHTPALRWTTGRALLAHGLVCTRLPRATTHA